MDAPQENHFNRQGIFYPLVTTYLHQLIGIRQICLDGLVGQESADRMVSRFLNGRPESEIGKDTIDELASAIAKLKGPLELACRHQTERIVVDVDEVARDTAQNHKYHMAFSLVAAGQLLLMAFELCKELGLVTSDPEWEFLRHCRNGAAHGGRFSFRGSEPKRQASWRNLVIDAGLNDTPLFQRPDGSGFLRPGDPIKLLWDLEQGIQGVNPPQRLYDWLL